jgi:hypothetical protein
VNRLRRVLLLTAVLALAGCAGSNPTPGTPTPPSTVTNEQALAALDAAAQKMPEKYGMELTIVKGSTTLLSLKGAFDNASGTSYAEITADPGALGNPAAASLAPLLAKGFTVYSTKDGGVYLANGTAIAFPPSGEQAGGIPSPDKTEFGKFLQPLNGPFKDTLRSDKVHVTNATAITHKGQPAMELNLTSTENNQTVTGTVILYANPPRLAHIESTIPPDPKSPQDPYAGGRATADFAYDADVTLAPTPAVLRALGLAYATRGDGANATTWTFATSGGVATSDADAQVKNASAASSGAMDPASIPTAWSLKLSDGNRTQDGVTLAFTDADQDGKVSKGDTLRIEWTTHARPILVLHDDVTGTYVVPGAGAIAVPLALAAAALLLARRR